jgi:hypothetical protein
MASSNPKPDPEEVDAGHVPITEEFDSAKHTLPDKAPLIIGLVLIVAVVAAIAFLFRPKPIASGAIDNAAAVQQGNQASVLSSVTFTIKNLTEKPIQLRGITATLRTDQGEWSDESAAAVDFERYFQAYPDLRQHTMAPMARETKIDPGQQRQGSIIVAYPITKEQFDQKKALELTVSLYDQNPLVIKKTY